MRRLSFQSFAHVIIFLVGVSLLSFANVAQSSQVADESINRVSAECEISPTTGEPECTTTTSSSTTLAEETIGKQMISELPLEIMDNDTRCRTWALEWGECNRNTEYMLRECIRSCLDPEVIERHGLLTFGSYNKYRILLRPTPSVPGRRPDGDECVDTYDPEVDINTDGDGCQNWAERGECHMKHSEWMLTKCAKSCLVCIPRG